MSSTAQAAPAGSALSVAEMLDTLDSVLDSVLSMQWWQAPDGEVTDAAVALGRVVSRAQALLTRAVGEVDARDLGVRLGAVTTAAWTRNALNLTMREARALTAVGVATRAAMPETGAAFATGEITLGHAVAVTRAVSDLPADVPAEVRERAEAELVRYADRFDAVQLARLGSHILTVVAPEVGEALDAERLEREEARARARRELFLFSDGHGTVHLRGRLTEEAAAIVRAALDPLSALLPPCADGPDPRTAPQRRADALVELARRALAGTDDLPPDGSGAANDSAPRGTARPVMQVAVLIPLRTLVDRVGAATLPDGTRISPGLARRMACDAELIPAVLGAGSAVLDVGRAQRLFSGARRRALVLRDKGCAFPGCDRPPSGDDCYCHCMRAAIYLRQSKDTAGTGLAVDRQRIDCEKLAAERGWTVVATFTDNDLSASNGKARPGYVQLLALIDSRAVDIVVAWHVDRITRRLAELEDLITRCEEASVRVATVSGDLDLATDAGRLVGRILGAVARGEIERKSARQKRAALQAAESGRPPSRRAFGFTNGGHDPAEAPALGELYGKVLAGMSMVAATRWLNDGGHRTTTGRCWDRSSVRKMLLNPRNAGLRAHRGEVVAAGTWQPIVAEEVWRAVVEKIADPARRSHSGNGRRWLGGGLYLCHCGAKVRVNYSHHGQRVYQCQSSAHLSRSADPIDDLVSQVMVARLRRADLADLLAPDNREEVAALRDEATTLRLRLDQVGADYADGLLTGRQLHTATERVTGQLQAAERALADAGRGSRLAPLLGAADPGQAWADADLPTRQAVLDTLAVVTVLPGTPGRAPFNPASVSIEWRQS